jgi:hypothetical protein
MTRQVVVVLGATSFRIDVAPTSLWTVSGPVNGAQLVVDARALDTRALLADANIVAPLFASANASLNNVAALRVVTLDCLVASNATLGVAGPLIVALFHVTVRSASCLGASSTVPVPHDPSDVISALTTTSVIAPLAVSSAASPKAEEPADIATNSQASWILPAAVTGAAVSLALFVGIAVAVLLWKKRKRASSKDTTLTDNYKSSARAPNTSEYGAALGAARTPYAEHAVLRVADAHYDQLSPSEVAATITSRD